MQLLTVVVVVLYMVVMIVLANQADQKRFPRRKLALAYPYRVEETTTVFTDVAKQDDTQTAHPPTLLLMQAAMLSVLLLISGNALFSTVNPSEGVDPLDLNVALTVAGTGFVAVLICAAVVFSRPTRVWMSERLGTHGSFHPDSHVHITAFVLAIAILAFTLMEITQLGGVEGLAENLQEEAPSILDTVLQQFIGVVGAFLGVGLIVRRNWGQVLERLALRLPTFEDVLWGVATAFGCLVLIFVFSILLTLFLSPEAINEQSAASQEIARLLGGSLVIAFTAALAAAVGEEILFRGALQPVFGLVPTTLFFALLHSQYALTPASAIIVIVGGAFGVLKQRQSTTAAIIAHFIYNFVLLGLAYLSIQLQESGLFPELTEGAFLIASLIFPI